MFAERGRCRPQIEAGVMAIDFFFPSCCTCMKYSDGERKEPKHKCIHLRSLEQRLKVQDFIAFSQALTPVVQSSRPESILSNPPRTTSPGLHSFQRRLWTGLSVTLTEQTPCFALQPVITKCRPTKS